MIETSTEVAALFKALAAFQGAVKSPKKLSRNPHFNSKFADLAEVLETARAPLSANGLALVQVPFGDCDGVIRVVTMVTHESGQWLRATVSMPVAQKTPQAVGSAISYARRYCAMAALGMAADDDDGESAEGRGKAAKQEQRTPQDRLDALARGGERAVERPTEAAKTAAEPSATASRTNGPASAPAEDGHSATGNGRTAEVTPTSAQTASAATSPATTDGELLDAKAWRARYEAEAEAAMQQGVIFAHEDDQGLPVPPFDEPRTSKSARKYPDTAYSQLPGGFVREVIVGHKTFDEMPLGKRLFALYCVARHELAKDGGHAR